MNGMIWVVEREEDGEWLFWDFAFTRAMARATARWARTDSQGYPFRVRKYVRAE